MERGPGKSKGLGERKWETTESLEQGSRRFRPCVREGCLEPKRPILVKATTNHGLSSSFFTEKKVILFCFRRHLKCL